uniref:Uncharacterized protein n=1 Tax=Rhizophora mucronata TaxID=61149 RepID=A0A2P2QDP0_RHIMU
MKQWVRLHWPKSFTQTTFTS